MEFHVIQKQQEKEEVNKLFKFLNNFACRLEARDIIYISGNLIRKKGKFNILTSAVSNIAKISKLNLHKRRGKECEAVEHILLEFSSEFPLLPYFPRDK